MNRTDTESYTEIYIPVPEGYVAFVEELPGANTQGATLREAIDLVSEVNRGLSSVAPEKT